jgi:hypothetical protein
MRVFQRPGKRMGWDLWRHDEVGRAGLDREVEECESVHPWLYAHITVSGHFE